MSFQDEFGGYSSRLRLHQADNNCDLENDMGGNVELNLCELLGIDVEGIAYKLAMSEESEEEEQMGSGSTANSSSRKNIDCIDLN